MSRILPFLVLASVCGAQSQSVECASLTTPSADVNARQNASGVAAQIQPRRAAPYRSTSTCRCGTVDAGTLTAKSTTQEVPVLTAISGNFRFEHVLLRESSQFTSPTAGTLSVAMGRAGTGSDVTSPFALRNPAAPHSFWYERPGPPQLTGAYDLVLLFQASFPLGDGTATNYKGGTVTWEVCGFNGTPAPVR